MSRYGETKLASDEIAVRIEREFLPKCAYVTAASPGIAKAYSTKYGIDLPATILNVFPLDLRPACLSEVDANRPLRLFWFSQTIGKMRGIEHVLAAMAPLQKLAIELHLQGEWQQGYESHVRRYAQRLGIADRQIVWHAPAPLDQLVENAAQYDVGLALELNCSPNRAICLTNKLFIYLLAGNAIAATDTPAQRALMDTLRDVGICFNQKDPAGLTKWLLRCHTDRSFLADARRHSWHAASSVYNWGREGIKLINLVSELFGRERTSSAGPAESVPANANSSQSTRHAVEGPPVVPRQVSRTMPVTTRHRLQRPDTSGRLLPSINDSLCF